MGLSDAAPVPGGPAHRILVVHLPAFRLERCGYGAHEAAALIAEVRGSVRVVACTPGARRAGLEVGMSGTEARACCPGIALEPWDEAGEQVDRDALAAAFGRFSDRVIALSAEDLALEIGATAHLFGGEPGVCAAAAELAGRFGHVAFLAVADDPATARAVASASAAIGPGAGRDGDGPSGRPILVPPGRGAAALAPLPVWALFPEPGLARSLASLGIDTIGQFAALDPASVAGRFGAVGVRLHRVARGEGALQRPIAWKQGRPPVVAEVVLGGPTVTLAPIHFVLPGLLRRVAAALEARGEVAVRLVVGLVLDTGATRRIAVRPGRPTRCVETLERLIRTRLDGVKLDAPVVGLSVEVEEGTAELEEQPGLVDRTGAREPLPDLLARLSETLGHDALFAAAPVSTWRPEGAWRPVPFRPRAAPPPPPRPRRPDPVDAVVRYEATLPRPRPTRLLERPEAIRVRVEGDRPVAVQGRHGWEPIARLAGPEHLASGWWDPEERFDRICWVAQTRSGIQWIVQEDGRWFRHGWFD